MSTRRVTTEDPELPGLARAGNPAGGAASAVNSRQTAALNSWLTPVGKRFQDWRISVDLDVDEVAAKCSKWCREKTAKFLQIYKLNPANPHHRRYVDYVCGRIQKCGADYWKNRIQEMELSRSNPASDLVLILSEVTDFKFYVVEFLV